jgi:parallel beta helix pectate lyase-like protein
VLRMTFRNAGGECLRLRYFAQRNEIAGSSFVSCGVHDFRFGAGGKNGEAIYIGTAPEQRGDGKNPTRDPDQSNDNWVHHNSFNTQGNECVDIKEASSANVVEDNICTGQRDPESGGFDARGSGNVFRRNESYGNAGAGIRLGGDTPADGTGNDVYGNMIHDNRAGGIKIQQQPQGSICDNVMSNNAGGDAVGTYRARFSPAAPCKATPMPTSTPAPAPAGCAWLYNVDGAVNAHVEAEQYTSAGGRFAAATVAGRSGGRYMTIPGSGKRSDPSTYLTFDLKVSGGGKFYVWLLGYGPDDSSDSFYVQADSGAIVQANLAHGKWGWKKADSALALGDGAHALKIKDREDGASVDKIMLTRDKSFTPTALGGAALVAQCR